MSHKVERMEKRLHYHPYFFSLSHTILDGAIELNYYNLLAIVSAKTILKTNILCVFLTVRRPSVWACIDGPIFVLEHKLVVFPRRFCQSMSLGTDSLKSVGFRSQPL